MERMEMYAKEALPLQGREGQQVQPAYKLSALVAWVEELPPLDDLKPIDQQRQRIIAYWRALPYEERDRQFLKECFYQYQADIVLMLDSLFSRSAEALSKVLKKVLAALMACLEALLEFIERHRPQYFNTGQRLPECLRQRKALEQNADLPEGCTYGQLTGVGVGAIDLPGSACTNCLDWLLEDCPEEEGPEELRERKKYERLWAGFKLHTPMNAKEIGLFWGMLLAAGVFRFKRGDKRPLFMFFAQHTRTDDVVNMSARNMYNQSTSKELPVLEGVRKYFLKVVSIIDDLLKRYA